MIRRPSYRQFLHQTKEVQSSINLSFNEASVPFSHPVDTSQNEVKVKPPNADRPWQGKYLDVVKYLPDDPRALRHTYAKQPFGRSTINQSFTKSFQMLSPHRQTDQLAFKRTTTNAYPRSTFRQQSKKQTTPLEQPLEFTRTYIAKPMDAGNMTNTSFNKSLYQSKSSTKLRVVRNDEGIQKEIDRLKQLRNRRMQNNANNNYRYEDRLQTQNIHLLPKSSVNIAREEKENRFLGTVEAERKKELDRSARKEQDKSIRNDKSKSPIKQIPTHNEIKTFVPIQFKKKGSNYEDEKVVPRQLSKSPLKKTSSFVASGKDVKSLSQVSINEVPKQVKPKVKQQLSLQDFVLGKKLGQGRFGIVWLATQKQTGAIFALKKIAKSTIKDNFMIEQFILEVKIQSFIQNPFIVKVYGIFDDKESIYLLLEYLEGGSLYNILKKGIGKLTEEDVSMKIRMICQAVNCLHEKGIAHRDIKPQNIILTNQICKLGDFGWATFCDQRRRTYCGTTDYVAPEIVEGLEYDMSVDLWCIGVLTYELLSGRAPFYHISRQQTFNKIKNVDSSSLKYPEYFTSEAVDFIGSLIKKSPTERMNMPEALKHPFITKYHF